MALLRAGDRRVDADLVVFDKDGTLIDFEYMWGKLLAAAIGRLAGAVADSNDLAGKLYASVGYDPVEKRADPRGPWAMAPTGQVLTIFAATLYRYGTGWPEAEEVVRAIWLDVSDPSNLTGLIRPVTDLVGLFSGLRQAGVRTAIVTTDERRLTEETLRLLDLNGVVDAVICGDDDVLAKPAPDAVLAICQGLAVLPGRTVVVGDTSFDIQMGRRAGAGLVIGVLGGVGDRQTLAPEADVLLPTIASLEIVTDAGGK